MENQILNLGQVVILAIVQGVTEFLPISSSGHLVILQKFFGFFNPPVTLDILLHFGTIIAILFFWRKKIYNLVKNWKKNLRLFFLVILGSVPAGIVGFLVRDDLKVIFNSFFIAAVGYLVSGLLLFSTIFIKTKKQKGILQIRMIDSFLVGLFQALAILPGISRSGATIVSGLWLGFSSQTAFYFSFLLAIPVIFGATLVEASEFLSNGSLGYGIFAMTISAIIGYFSLKYVENILKRKKIFLFGWYCLLLSFWLFLR